MQAGPVWQYNDRVITCEDGQPPSPMAACQNFKQISDRIRPKGMTLHQPRHSFATQASTNGANMSRCRRRSDTCRCTTLVRYRHREGGEEEAVAQRINEVFGM